MTLKEAKIGSTVTVTKVGGEGALKRRIMDMGITKGVRGLRAQGGAAGRSGGGNRARLRAERCARRTPNSSRSSKT